MFPPYRQNLREDRFCYFCAGHFIPEDLIECDICKNWFCHSHVMESKKEKVPLYIKKLYKRFCVTCDAKIIR